MPTVAPESFGLQIDAECTEDSPTLVRCTWTQRGGVFERSGTELTASVALLLDDGGLIVAQDVTFVGDPDPVADFYPAFGSWLQDAHPDIFEATYNTVLPDPLANDAIDTIDSPAQWAAVLDEFLAQSNTNPLDG